jgi:hypothetical protein
MVLTRWTHMRPSRWGRYGALPIRDNDPRYGTLSPAEDIDQAVLLT